MKKKIYAAVCLGLLALAPLTVSGVDNATQMTQNKDSYAEIKFDSMSLNLGTFPENDPVRKCTFRFTNTGTAPLVIHQAFASCGCTVATYTRTPIKPGNSGTINVTYNGEGKFPGRFQKVVTVRSNAQNNVVRLVIKGNMIEK